MRFRTPALGRWLVAAVAALGLCMSATSATAIEDLKSSTDGWGGNYLQQRLWFDFAPHGCYGGKDGYRMKRTTFTFTKADGQFTAGFKKGVFGVAALGCQQGSGYFKRNKSFSGPTVLEPKKTYTRYFGTPSKWVVVTGADSYGEMFQSYVVLNLYRGGHWKAYLCTHPKVVSPGNACANY